MSVWIYWKTSVDVYVVLARIDNDTQENEDLEATVIRLAKAIDRQDEQRLILHSHNDRLEKENAALNKKLKMIKKELAGYKAKERNWAGFFRLVCHLVLYL